MARERERTGAGGNRFPQPGHGRTHPACGGSGRPVTSAGLRANAIELPDLQRWTGTLQRVVDPCIGVVKERGYACPLGLGHSGSIRRKYRDPPGLACERRDERDELLIQCIVSLEDDECHAEALQRR